MLNYFSALNDVFFFGEWVIMGDKFRQSAVSQST